METDAHAYAHLLGLYLGDGHLLDTGRTHQLRVHLDDAFPGIVEAAATSITTVAGGRVPRRHRDGRGHRMWLLTCGWRDWPRWLPQHGPGRKHERPMVLEPWQERAVHEAPWAFLRGLLHSDGCRTTNRFTTVLPSGRRAEYAYGRWFFSNHSADIRGMFTRTCDLVGVHWTPAGPRNVSVARRASVALVDKHVGPKT